MKQLLIKLNAWSEFREWAEDKTIEQIVEQCHRGDWMLWLAEKVDIGLQPLTLAKGHCVNTVRHLMKDERSIKAVDAAIAFGEGKATREELDASAASAAWAVDAAIAFGEGKATREELDASAASAAWADAAWAAAATWADARADAATWADAAWVADAARDKNQKQTADICRKYIGQLIIDKCNELNSNL